jgi:hypothetical protein
MTSQTETHTLAAPSLSKLARTTGLALLLAGVLLITIVLPAEYAIDPIGTGRWLGLTQIAAPAVSVVEPVNAEGAPLAPTQKGPIGEYPREFKYDVFEIELGAYEYGQGRDDAVLVDGEPGRPARSPRGTRSGFRHRRTRGREL